MTVFSSKETLRKLAYAVQVLQNTCDFVISLCRFYCRGRRRKVQRFQTHVHNHCSACEAFCSLTLPIASQSWFANKTPYS